MVEDSRCEEPRPSQRWAQVAAIIVSFAPAVWGATWSVYTYTNTAAKQEASVARARLIEAQQPFLQRQLEVFFETVELAGRLVADVPCTPKYEGDVQRFSALFWSTMTMVESSSIRDAMVDLKVALDNYLDGGKICQKVGNKRGESERADDTFDLQRAVWNLARAIRGSIEHSWSGGPGAPPIVTPSPRD